MAHEGENVIDIYPNPITNSTFFLHNKVGSVLKVQFINLEDRMLKEFSIASGQSKLSTGDLPKGLYFLRVLSNNEIIQNHTVLID